LLRRTSHFEWPEFRHQKGRARRTAKAGSLVTLVAQKSTRVPINQLFLLGFIGMTLFSGGLALSLG
jgi:hypothetical protein